MKTAEGVIVTSFSWQIFPGNDCEARNTEGVEGVKSSEARFMSWKHPQICVLVVEQFRNENMCLANEVL